MLATAPVISSVHVTHAVPFTFKLSPDYALSPAFANMGDFPNALVCLSFLLNATLSATAMRVVVARAKKCWDFGLTMYIIHLAAVSAWSGFPLRWFWWVLQISCATVTVLLGEFLCVRFEMAEIPIAGAAPCLTSCAA